MNTEIEIRLGVSPRLELVVTKYNYDTGEATILFSTSRIYDAAKERFNNWRGT